MGAQRHRDFRVEQGVGVSDNCKAEKPNRRPQVSVNF